MAIEFDVRIIGETSAAVMRELTEFSTRLSGVLGVAPTTAQPNEPMTEPLPAKANGADAAAPAKPRGKKATVAEPEPATTKGPDRAGIIDGLTKIYGKGDPEMRKRITEFRDEHGADRLRDLKDEDLPAAAQLLVDLKLAEADAAP